MIWGDDKEHEQNEMWEEIQMTENKNLEEIFKYMCENGYKHHVAIAKGEWSDCVEEALVKYLGYNIDVL